MEGREDSRQAGRKSWSNSLTLCPTASWRYVGRGQVKENSLNISYSTEFASIIFDSEVLFMLTVSVSY